MKQARSYNLKIWSAALGIVVLQFLATWFWPNHIGTDDQGVDIIHQVAPEYQPWAQHVFELKYDWMEPVLFALQAILGLSIIVFYLLKKRKTTSEK